VYVKSLKWKSLSSTIVENEKNFSVQTKSAKAKDTNGLMSAKLCGETLRKVLELVLWNLMKQKAKPRLTYIETFCASVDAVLLILCARRPNTHSGRVCNEDFIYSRWRHIIGEKLLINSVRSAKQRLTVASVPKATRRQPFVDHNVCYTIHRIQRKCLISGVSRFAPLR